MKEEESKSVVTDVTKPDPMIIDGHNQVDGIFFLSFFLYLCIKHDSKNHIINVETCRSLITQLLEHVGKHIVMY